MKRIIISLIATLTLCACGNAIQQDPTKPPSPDKNTISTNNPHQPQDPQTTASTNIEYTTFKTTFLHIIGEVQETNIFANDSDYIQEYEFQDVNHSIRFAIGRTTDIEHLESEGWSFPDNPPRAVITNTESPMHMSQNGRFFLILYDEPQT